MTAIQQIKTVFSQAIQSFGHNKVALFKALLPVGILYFIFLGLAVSSATTYFVASFINLFVLAHIMIIIHKITLLGADSVPEWGVWLWGKKEFKFCLHIVISFIAIGIIMAFLGPFLVFLPILGYFVAAYMVARFYLILPSAAIGDKMPIEESWKTTLGHGIMMFVVVSLLPFITNIFEVFVKESILKGKHDAIVIAEIIPTLFIAPVLVFQVVLLSEAYRYCIQFRPQKLEDIPAEALSSLTSRKDILPKD